MVYRLQIKNKGQLVLKFVVESFTEHANEIFSFPIINVSILMNNLKWIKVMDEWMKV